MTDSLWIVRMELVGTFTQFSAAQSVIRSDSNARLVMGDSSPLSNVRGSLATSTTSAPLSLRSI